MVDNSLSHAFQIQIDQKKDGPDNVVEVSIVASGCDEGRQKSSVEVSPASDVEASQNGERAGSSHRHPYIFKFAAENAPCEDEGMRRARREAVGGFFVGGKGGSSGGNREGWNSPPPTPLDPSLNLAPRVVQAWRSRTFRLVLRGMSNSLGP